MVGPFVLDYFVFVFLAALGVIQVAASYSDLRRLLFIPSRRAAVAAGTMVTAAAFAWFFLSEPRNISDDAGGLDGNQMAGLFALGAGSALIGTLLLSSLLNRSLESIERHVSPGLDALRETTYINAILRTLKHLWKHYGALTQK